MSYNDSMKRGILWLAVVSIVGVGVASAQAATFTSPNFSINGSVGDSVAGGQDSTNYSMVSAGGESIAGTSESQSYKLGEGFIATLEQSLQLSVAPTLVELGNVTPSVSSQSDVTVEVLTGAPGYEVAVNQTGPLQDGGNTIDSVSGSLSTPIVWNEGTTKGLGFSLVSSSATAVDGKWSSGASYAALPDTATTVYTRSGYSGGATDTLTMRLRLDVPVSQPTGNYANQVVWTGTITP